MSAAADAPLDRAWLGGCPLSRCSRAELLTRALLWARGERASRAVMAVNVSKLVMMQRDERLAAAVRGSAATIADGSPVYLALRLLGDPVPERITGVELMLDLLRLADTERLSVYFLGARPEVVRKVAERCAREHPGAAVLGARDGFFADAAEAAAEVARLSPDVLFLGLGLPQKEYFVLDHGPRLRAGVVLPVGGGFDVYAGVKRRAPRLVQSLGVEWLWRSAYDRSRAELVRRSLLPFAAIVAREALARRRWRRAAC